MTDQTPENTNGPAASESAAKRPRRAASRPAGPPAEGVAADQPTTKPAAKKPAKKAAKAPAKSPAPAAAEAVAPAAAEAQKPAKKPLKKTRGGAKAKVEAGADQAASSAEASNAALSAVFQAPDADKPARPSGNQRNRNRKPKVDDAQEASSDTSPEDHDDSSEGEDGDSSGNSRRRRRRGGRRRRKPGSQPGIDGQDSHDSDGDDSEEGESEDSSADDSASDGSASSRRRRNRRKPGGSDHGDESSAVRGSTRLEAKKQRRREGREAGRRRAPILSEAEFLARRENVHRVMVVRQVHDRVQIAVLEDDVLVEHYVNRQSGSTMMGNVYLGRIQNVLPSMEAAFVDIGRGRNAVLYAGEVNWDAAGLEGESKRIEMAFKPGDPVLVQVTKDPIGHKGARLTAQISMAGRFLVYVPDGSMTGISRKLPEKERNRLKTILRSALPEEAGVIVRTAAEGAAEDDLVRDVARLTAQWQDIEAKSKTASAPSLLYAEPDLAIRVVRDIFNEDFNELVVSGDDIWETLEQYVTYVAPDLAPRLRKWVEAKDLFNHYRIDEQLAKALDRKVWLPSGGSLVIDRTEAMTVVDVNTGKFTGEGGNLEQTVTRNNLEAAEEIVRQLRLRDIGGIIVVDFIDMVLETNRDLVLRRLIECLGRDRTKHQVAEVTSLGLVQMTRKRLGQGLLETFSEPCEHCHARGVKVRLDVASAKTSHVSGADDHDHEGH